MLSCAGCAKRTRNRGVDTWAIAMTLFYRFYARKSMKKNNSFVSAECEGREEALAAGVAGPRVVLPLPVLPRSWRW